MQQCAGCSLLELKLAVQWCGRCTAPLIFIDQPDMKETCGRRRRHWQARIHKQLIPNGNQADGDDDKNCENFYRMSWPCKSGSYQIISPTISVCYDAPIRSVIFWNSHSAQCDCHIYFCLFFLRSLSYIYCVSNSASLEPGCLWFYRVSCVSSNETLLLAHWTLVTSRQVPRLTSKSKRVGLMANRTQASRIISTSLERCSWDGGVSSHPTFVQQDQDILSTLSWTTIKDTSGTVLHTPRCDIGGQLMAKRNPTRSRQRGTQFAAHPARSIRIQLRVWELIYTNISQP